MIEMIETLDYSEFGILALYFQIPKPAKFFHTYVLYTFQSVEHRTKEAEMQQYLSNGSFGEAVRNLQAMLNQLQSSYAQLKEDAQFGPKTHARVVEFQNQSNLVPDGVAGPKTFEMLDQFVKQILTLGISPAGEAEARDRIVHIAGAHLAQWGGAWNKDDKLGISQKIAGKKCIDPVTRFRQGGAQIALFFSTMGVPNAAKCITISTAAEEMYGRKYTPQERNNIDIASWCGIFAFYIYKLAGLKKIPNWSAIKVHGVSTHKVGGVSKAVPRELCQMQTTTTPKKGDIGVIGAREVRDKNTGEVIIKMGQNHHFIITDVVGGRVDSIDGNAGMQMEILGNNYKITDVLLSGGFYTPIWENCM